MADSGLTSQLFQIKTADSGQSGLILQLYQFETIITSNLIDNCYIKSNWPESPG